WPEYVPPPNSERVILVDIDGTVAKMNGRSPYDMTRGSEDSPNCPLIYTVTALRTYSIAPGFASARHEPCPHGTAGWLTGPHEPRRAEPGGWRREETETPQITLFMRADGDGRKDSIVKRELFDKHIRHVYDVEFVLDDRQQVVDMWRNDLGLTVFQVAPGDF